TNTTGTLSNAPANILHEGNLTLGTIGGVSGKLVTHAAAVASGSFEFEPTANSGAYQIKITNAQMGQHSVITVPNPGAATANFLLDKGASNILTYQKFLGPESFMLAGNGDWAITRLAQGNYVYRHTVADESDIIGIDITPMIRNATDKGFRLNTFDVVYGIGS